MSHKAVIGLGFGDEGKGMVTDYLCSQNPNSLVVRFSGGHQAGHTVYNKNINHVFSNFGSGTLRNIPTCWSEFCTIDPCGIINELIELHNKNIYPVLYINSKCPVTTPYDKLNNQNSKQNIKHGTCGVGFGSTIKREEDNYSLLYEDLFFPKIIIEKLKLIQEYYSSKITIQNNIIQKFIQDCKTIRHYFSIHEIPLYNNIIYEGSQGLLLDQKIGFFPYVTRAYTGSKNLLKLYEYPEINLVTRAYQTRHGNGPMTNENIPLKLINNKKETNKQHKYQGKFRTTILDLDLIKYAINKDDYIKSCRKTLFITCIDQLKEFSFTFNEKLIISSNIEEFVKNIIIYLNENINNIFINDSIYGNFKKII